MFRESPLLDTFLLILGLGPENHASTTPSAARMDCRIHLGTRDVDQANQL